jgi:hypothetical protein
MVKFGDKVKISHILPRSDFSSHIMINYSAYKRISKKFLNKKGIIINIDNSLSFSQYEVAFKNEDKTRWFFEKELKKIDILSNKIKTLKELLSE